MPYDDRPHEPHDFSVALPSVSMDNTARAEFFCRNGFTWGQIERTVREEDISHEHFRYGILLRDPLELAHSAANYHDLNEPWTNHTHRYKKHLACLEEAADACLKLKGDLWMYFDNFVVRTLGGPEVASLPPGGVTETDALRVIKKLSDFDMVAFVDEFKDGINARSFSKTLGWDSFILGTSRVEEGVNRFSFSLEEAALIKERSELDYMVHNHFRQLAPEQRYKARKESPPSSSRSAVDMLKTVLRRARRRFRQ